MYNIMALAVEDRSRHSVELQEKLSEYGCSIKARLGLHDTSESCSEEGLLILQLTGEQENIKALSTALNEIDGIRATNIVV